MDSNPTPPASKAGYSFALSDDAFLTHLETEGFCVIKGAAADEAPSAEALFWDYLCSRGDIKRENASTWLRANGWPGGGRGFSVEAGGGCHTPAAWLLRGAPGVKQAFARVWGTNDLLVSFDTFIAWRPWSLPLAPSQFKPVVEGLHLDQNPFFKPGRQCVQGMVPLRPVTAEVGGLAVVPRSHLPVVQEALAAQHAAAWSSDDSDWCVLSASAGRALLAETPEVLVLAEPGDLILWDSRTVHEGVVGTGAGAGGSCTDAAAPLLRPQPQPQLARLAFTVTMTPKALAKPGVLAARRAGLAAGVGFTHWPHEAHRAGPPAPRGWSAPDLTPAQLDLVA